MTVKLILSLIFYFDFQMDDFTKIFFSIMSLQSQLIS